MVLEPYLRLKLNTQDSVHDNLENNVKVDPSQPIMEFSIIKLFIINLVQLIKNKVALAKNFYIAPSEIDRLFYWEYEYMFDEINKSIKAENERNEKENAKYGDMNPRSMMRDAGRYMHGNSSGYNLPHMPKMPSFSSVPSMPHF